MVFEGRRAREDATVEMAGARDSGAGDQLSGEETVLQENPVARVAMGAMFESSLAFLMSHEMSTADREPVPKVVPAAVAVVGAMAVWALAERNPQLRAGRQDLLEHLAVVEMMEVWPSKKNPNS